MFKFALYKVGQFIARHLPLKGAYKFAMFLSDMQYYFSPRDRRAVTDNLKVLLPDEENIAPLVRDVFRNFGKYLVDFFRMANEIDAEFIKENVELVNIDFLEQALKNKKGVLSLTAHIGNWELGAVVLSMLGYPPLAIALPHKERPVNDLFNKQRSAMGITVVPTSNAIRKSLETLKKNKLVAVVADRDFSANGEILDFFGKQALIPKGAAILAYKTGAAIVPSFLVRKEDGKFAMVFEKPIYAPRINTGRVSREDLLILMKKHTAVIEEKIRQYPTQWLMFRRFWV